MNTKSHAFSDVIDRLFAIQNTHAKDYDVEVYNDKSFGSWSGFMMGKFTYMVVKRGDKLYTLYVPAEAVRWLFDCYGN